jgi:hypothetical protein
MCERPPEMIHRSRFARPRQPPRAVSRRHLPRGSAIGDASLKPWETFPHLRRRSARQGTRRASTRPYPPRSMSSRISAAMKNEPLTHNSAPPAR